jgi:hypothetical protein
MFVLDDAGEHHFFAATRRARKSRAARHPALLVAARFEFERVDPVDADPYIERLTEPDAGANLPSITRSTVAATGLARVSEASRRGGGDASSEAAEARNSPAARPGRLQARQNVMGELTHYYNHRL